MILGVGTDIVEIDRIAELNLQRFGERILSEEEYKYIPKNNKRKIEYLAGRFAAKEAISKALGTGIGAVVGFQDIEITKTNFGAPKALLGSLVLEKLFMGQKIKIHLSISHSENYAIATAIIEEY